MHRWVALFRQATVTLSATLVKHFYNSTPLPQSLRYLRESIVGYSVTVTSNGKSSIVQERLYSFFFALFEKRRNFVFFRFSSSSQSLTKTIVLLRFCKILKGFTSFLFVFANFWDTPIRFTFDFENIGLSPFASLHSSKILEQPGRFCFVDDKVRTPFHFVSSGRNWRLNQLAFASIPRMKLRFCFDHTVCFASILKGSEKFYNNY